MDIKKVGVVGCGFMGSGITQVCAQSGYQVVVSDVNDEYLNRGLASIEHFLTRGVDKGRMSQQEKDSTLARIKCTTDIKEFNDCDIVVEAVPEDIEMKKGVFIDLDSVCPEHSILTTNTSCLSVTEIGSVTRRMNKIVGTHFLSPVPSSKLLEIVRTIVTTDETLEAVVEFGHSLGKEVIIAKDTPGFIFSYLLTSLEQAAIYLLENGIATKEDIDKSMALGLGHPIGPLALMDFNGVDVGYMVTKAMYEQTKDPKFAPSVLMKNMIAAGWLGRKSGRGFYEHT